MRMLPNLGGNSAHRVLVPLTENVNNPSSPVRERQVKFLGKGCGTVSSTFEIGITTFAETYPEGGVATVRGHGRRLREVVEEAQLSIELLGREVAPIVREAMAEEPRRKTVHS
ncbi:hypothetical protein ASG56_01660 [Rhodococcus sp. Leaf7]|nr:hypothetical protein ASG56_01660 [Rhodococcus sp. Leaf7]KQU41933.1 hypothetical protein ASG64_01660 [Rhodococcus sp. Leaf247]